MGLIVPIEFSALSDSESTNRIRAEIADADAQFGLLPLVHCSDAYRFMALIRDAKISPHQCDVFNEKLVYTFVGRPAYRTRQQSNPNLNYDLPIAIIISNNIENVPIRIFPFDTGAFDIGCEMSDASKYISHFYRSNAEYYTGSTRKNVDIPFEQFELAGLYELARNPADPAIGGSAPPDERSSSVEVQFDSVIDLSTTEVLGIVVPQVMMDQADVRDLIKSIGPKYLKSYSVINRHGSAEISGAIYELVKQIYEAEKFFE
jgi:hypothetical protein